MQGRAVCYAWGSLGGRPLNPREWKGVWDETPSRGWGGRAPTYKFKYQEIYSPFSFPHSQLTTYGLLNCLLRESPWL